MGFGTSPVFSLLCRPSACFSFLTSFPSFLILSAIYIINESSLLSCFFDTCLTTTYLPYGVKAPCTTIMHSFGSFKAKSSSTDISSSNNQFITLIYHLLSFSSFNQSQTYLFYFQFFYNLFLVWRNNPLSLFICILSCICILPFYSALLFSLPSTCFPSILITLKCASEFHSL